MSRETRIFAAIALLFLAVSIYVARLQFAANWHSSQCLITALPLNIDRRPAHGATECNRIIVSSSPAFLSLPLRPTHSVPCLSPTRSFSPIKQYLYANHPGLIATALHAWVIRVTIMVSRSPIVSFAAAGTYPRRLPCATVRGTQWRFIRGTKNLPDDCTAAAATKHSHYPLIRIPGFFGNAPRRHYYCHYASSERLGTRIVRRATI